MIDIELKLIYSCWAYLDQEVMHANIDTQLMIGVDSRLIVPFKFIHINFWINSMHGILPTTDFLCSVPFNVLNVNIEHLKCEPLGLGQILEKYN